MPETITISNYDALAEPPSSSHDGKLGAYQLEKHNSHVGNNRLQVFLNLYRQAYDEALRRGDANECNSVVNKIVSTVCQQCVPPGRFLVDANSSQGEAGGDPIWQQMEEGTVKELIHAILKPSQDIASGSDMQRSNPSAASLSPSTATGLESSEAPDNQKRRRRSSLLRRSTSEGMLDVVLDGKKKMSRMQDELSRAAREEPTLSSFHGTNINGVVTSLNRMDVILTTTGDALDPNSQSVGNNRLHILVAMQSGKYQQATIHGREAILDEVVQTVNTFWKGRFLTESSKGYAVLGKEDARNALRSIFDMRSGQNLLSKGRSIDVAPIIAPEHNHAHSFHTKGVTAATFPGPCVNTALLKQVSMSMPPTTPGMISRKQGMHVVRQVSSSVLPSGNASYFPAISPMGAPRQVSASSTSTQPVALPTGLDEFRSAAVKSLQKQKARQAIATRLEMVSRNGNKLPTLNPVIESVVLTHRCRDINSTPRGLPSSGSNVRSFSSVAEQAKKRQSTILGMLDPSVMEQLVADFDDADCNDDEPLKH